MNVATVLGWMFVIGMAVALWIIIKRWKPEKETDEDWIDRQW